MPSRSRVRPRAACRHASALIPRHDETVARALSARSAPHVTVRAADLHESARARTPPGEPGTSPTAAPARASVSMLTVSALTARPPVLRRGRRTSAPERVRRRRRSRRRSSADSEPLGPRRPSARLGTRHGRLRPFGRRRTPSWPPPARRSPGRPPPSPFTRTADTSWPHSSAREAARTSSSPLASSTMGTAFCAPAEHRAGCYRDGQRRASR